MKQYKITYYKTRLISGTWKSFNSRKEAEAYAHKELNNVSAKHDVKKSDIMYEITEV